MPLAHGTYDVALQVRLNHCDGQRVHVTQPIVEALIVTDNVHVVSTVRHSTFELVV